jgi:solute carrier family 35
MTSTPPPPPVDVWAAVTYYGLCSSTLLIANKMALVVVPAPIFLLSIQLWFAVVSVYVSAMIGIIDIQAMQWSTALKFSPVVASFLGTLFANAKVLQYSNVETFITFRSSTPLVLCVCDYVFLNRDLPSARSVACLVGLLLSSAGYALFDHMFDVRAYSWLAVWFVSFIAYEIVVKHLCDNVSMDNWTRVVYTNAMAGVLLSIALPFARDEQRALTGMLWDYKSVAILTTSCVIGLGVSHSAYVLRSACSATLSAVVGISCKVFTVLINVAIWDKHANPVQLVFLLLGLVAGSFYQQAPLRSDSKFVSTIKLDRVILSQRQSTEKTGIPDSRRMPQPVGTAGVL